MTRQRSFVRQALALVWRPVRFVLLGLLAVVLLLEEWGWRPLTALAARLAHWPPLARLEALIRRAPPRLALLLFLAPAVLLFPVKLAALWLIHRGKTLTGVLVIVLAKLIGTAIVGRLFVLTEPQLMRFAWFVRALGWWRATKHRVLEFVHSTWVWQAVKAASERVREWWRAARL